MFTDKYKKKMYGNTKFKTIWERERERVYTEIETFNITQEAAVSRMDREKCLLISTKKNKIKMYGNTKFKTIWHTV